MDHIKLIEIFLMSPALYIMSVVVWLLTYVVKKPIKATTARIKDEKKRKLANKWILLIPFFLAFLAVYVYSVIINKSFWPINLEKTLQDAFKVAALSILIYNLVEGLKGRKTEYQLDTDGAALFDLLLIYAKDPAKVKLLLDQCKENYQNGSYEISDTVKGWLPPGIDVDVINTIVKSIKIYLDSKSGRNTNEIN